MKIDINFGYNGRGVRQAEAGLGGLMRRSLAAKVSLAAVAAGFVRLGQQAISAAVSEEAAQRKLGRTLSNLGKGRYADAVLEQIGAMQLATGVSEDQLRPAFERLFLATRDVNGSLALLQTAMDTSVGTGKDLDSVVSALSKALVGNRKSLSTLGTGIDANVIKTGKLSDIVRELNRRFGGQEAAQADSYQGKISRVRLAADELKETVGTGLLNAFSALAGGAGGDIDGLISKMDTLGRSVQSVLDRIAKVIRNSTAATSAGATAGQIDYSGLNFQTGGPANVTGMKNTAEVERRRATALTIQNAQNAARAKALEKLWKADKARKDSSAAAAKAAAAAAKAEAAAASRLAAEKAKEAAARKKAAAEAAKELRLKMKAARFDLELINLEAAKKRTKSSETMDRLLGLQSVALGEMGLTAAQAGMSTSGTVINQTVTVQGSVVTQQELTNIIAQELRLAQERNGYGKWGGGL